MSRFQDSVVRASDRYSLGVDSVSQAHFLSIPVDNRLVDYEEHYTLSSDEFARFQADGSAGREFAEECRRRLHDDA